MPGFIGGLIGKGLIAYFVTLLIVGGISGESIVASIRSFAAQFSGKRWDITSIAPPLLIGGGAALFVYNFLAGTSSIMNCMVGIVAFLIAARALANRAGCVRQVVAAAFAKEGRVDSGLVTKVMMGGWAGGFALGGVVLSVFGGYTCYIAGFSLLVAGVVLMVTVQKQAGGCPGMRPMARLLLVLLAASLLSGTAAASYSLTDTNSYDYKLASKYIHSMEDEGFVVEMPVGVYKKGTDELLATENTLLIIGNLGKVDPEAERLVLTEIPTDVYSYTYQGDAGGGEIRQITGKVTAGRYIFTEFGLTTKYKTVGEYAGYLQTVLEESVKSSSAEIEYVDTTINGHRVVGVRELTDDLNWAAGGNVADNHLENTFTYYVIREDFYPAGSGLTYIRIRGHVGLEHDNGRSLTYDPYPSESQVGTARSEMRKAYEDANKVVDSIIADAANAKGTLIVGNYDEVFGGYGGGIFSIDTPPGGGGAGESDYGIPLAVITGIGAAGAAVAGAAAAAGGGKGGSETERTSTYRMRIRKDFEDYIVCGKSPETIYAQMIEITAEGETIERDDLTATLSITSGGGSGSRIRRSPAATWERSYLRTRTNSRRKASSGWPTLERAGRSRTTSTSGSSASRESRSPSRGGRPWTCG
ncbi:hypothetical protein [Methanoculleus chikugoensis]|uniref:hypothetical protein n=1 Tax=Methanoculleus chikugoensis TaxID=118126 RepID=UPI0006D1DB07|nr:hypothetical protein [Methanoculleus chikugoensis]